MSLSAVFCAKLIRDVFVPAGLSDPNAVALAVLCALGVAVLVGLTNAFLVVKVGIPAVIATIGMDFVVRGCSYSFTNGLPIYPLPPEVAIIGSWKPLGLSFTFFLMLGLGVVVHILLSRTKWGAALFATGGNKVAAQVCGINTDRVKTICFVLTSLLAGMAGMLTMSQLPQTPGDPIIGRFLGLDILAGIVIGGVSLFGGRGSAIGTFFGVLFIQVVRSGIIVGHFNSFLQTPVLGFLLVLAASVDVIRYFRRQA
jgi:ribose transport system permease protein